MTYSDPEYMNGMYLTHALCDYAASNWQGTGVVQQYMPIRMADITDGSSNTFLVGDKRLNLRSLGQVQNDDGVGYTSGWSVDTIRRTDKGPKPDYYGDGGSGKKRFGSSHTGGLNMVFADGSVHFIPYSIAQTTFSYLGNKSDGHVISGMDF